MSTCECGAKAPTFDIEGELHCGACATRKLGRCASCGHPDCEAYL